MGGNLLQSWLNFTIVLFILKIKNQYLNYSFFLILLTGGAESDGERTECTVSSERSCLYISEDSYPQFITDALDEVSLCILF